MSTPDEALAAAVFAAAFSATDDVTEEYIGFEDVTDRIAKELAVLGYAIVRSDELAGLRAAAEAVRTVKVHPETIEACLRELGSPGDRREAVVWSAAQGYVAARSALEGVSR